MAQLTGAWRTQPRGHVRIDTTNPLSSGLIAACPLAANTYNAVNTRQIDFVNGRLFLPTRFGVGANTFVDESSYLSLPIADFAPPTDAWTYSVTLQYTGVRCPIFTAWTNSGSGRNIAVYIDTGRLYVDVPFKQAIFNVVVSNDLAAHRYTVTRVGTAVTAYIDGVSVGSGTISTTQETSGVPFNLGRNTGNGILATGAIFLGFSAWKRGLSAQEVALDAALPWSIYSPRSFDLPMDVAAAGGGVTATLDVSDAADTLSGAAVVEVGASLAVTDAADTLSSTATGAITAALTATDAADTLTGAASVEVTASATLTDGADALSSTATPNDGETTATLDATDAPDTLTADASVAVTAALDLTDGDDVAANEATFTLDAGRRRRLKLPKRDEPKAAPEVVAPVIAIAEPAPTPAPTPAPEPAVAAALSAVVATVTRAPVAQRDDTLRAEVQRVAERLQVAEALLMRQAEAAIERQRREIEEDNAAAANAALMLLMA